MPKFLTIGYGDRVGYERTGEAARVAAHAADAALLAEGAAVQVRNPDGAGTVREEGAYMSSALPVAGFALIEARDLSHAIEKVSRVPCAVAHGVVEVWPLT